MTHRLVKHDSWPSGTKCDFHFAGGCCDRVQIECGDAECLTNLCLPDFRRHVIVEHDAAAGAGRARLHAPVPRHHDRDIEPYEWPDIGRPVPVRADDLYGLPGPGQRRADLNDPRVGGARKGVDFLEQGHLVLEGGAGEGIAVAVKRPVAR